jgi:uncharacterized damage-inducible protein DinB
MHAKDIQILYGYHFEANRKLWNDCIMPLSDEQFVQPLDYSIGSIRNQMVHLMDVEGGWFKGLRIESDSPPTFLNPEDWQTRVQIRTHWDIVEQTIQTYIDNLTDDICQQAFIQRQPGLPSGR